MIKTLVGDLFESKAQTLVNTVNCVGIMGKGVALRFKEQFPEMYQEYVSRCNRHEVQLGRPYLFKRVTEPWILNFPTKAHWRAVSRLADITRGLDFLLAHYKSWGITSLAVPPLGCGQGQLDWKVVGPTLFRALSKMDIPVEMYAPIGTPADQLSDAFLTRAEDHNGRRGPQNRINPSWLALIEILRRIEAEEYHWPIGRTTFQKIVYFATASGLRSGADFKRGSFGPFSDELKPILTKLINNGLLTEQKFGKMFRVRPGPTFADALNSYRSELLEHEDVIRRVTELFLAMNTADAEIAATVHFVAKEDPKASEFDVFNRVKHWKRRRRPVLDDRDIAQVVRELNILRWIDATKSDELPLSEDGLISSVISPARSQGELGF